MALRVFQQCQRWPTPLFRSSSLHAPLLHALLRVAPSHGPVISCRTVMTGLHISEGHNRAVIEEEVKTLVQKDWEVSDGKELRKTFHFKGHQKSIVRPSYLACSGPNSRKLSNFARTCLP